MELDHTKLAKDKEDGTPDGAQGERAKAKE